MHDFFPDTLTSTTLHKGRVLSIRPASTLYLRPVVVTASLQRRSNHHSTDQSVGCTMDVDNDAWSPTYGYPKATSS